MVHPFFKKIILKSALLVLFLGGLGMNEVSAVAPQISTGQIARKILGAPFRVVKSGVRKLAKGTANKLGLRKKRVNQKAANQATNKLKIQQGQGRFPEQS